jgi:hypothetical protein
MRIVLAMLHHPYRILNIGGVLIGIAIAFGGRVAAAQSPTDTPTPVRTGPQRFWISLGAGGGSSRQGGFATRAAATLAINRVFTSSLEGTGVGSVDGSISSIGLLAGLQTPAPDNFLFFSAGPANVSCGSGCGNQTGAAFDAGYHIGAKHGGVSVTGFMVRAPRGSNSSAVIVSLDLGWFDFRR